MKRKYRKEASKLDEKIHELTAKVGRSSEVVRERFRREDLALESMREQFGLSVRAVRDQLAATDEAVGQLHADLADTTRTLQGRTCLQEDRLGKMLGAVEEAIDNTPSAA